MFELTIKASYIWWWLSALFYVSYSNLNFIFILSFWITHLQVVINHDHTFEVLIIFLLSFLFNLSNFWEKVWKILQLWPKLLLWYQTLWTNFYPSKLLIVYLKVYMYSRGHVTIYNYAIFMMSTWTHIYF